MQSLGVTAEESWKPEKALVPPGSMEDVPSHHLKEKMLHDDCWRIYTVPD